MVINMSGGTVPKREALEKMIETSDNKAARMRAHLFEMRRLDGNQAINEMRRDEIMEKAEKGGKDASAISNSLEELREHLKSLPKESRI
jgi:hypothetical protein